MQIGCTKKLLDALAITVGATTPDKELFCWSANLLKIRHRKAVVVVNDSSRFGFVLYGLKARDLKQLQALIEDGIRQCLQDEGITAAVIDRYFAAAADVVFTKTRGRAAVARLSKACQRAELFADRLDNAELYQTELSKTINGELFKPAKDVDYAHPYELLIRDFKGLYGEKIIATKAADLLIRLDLGAYRASRRVVVPLGVTFNELHDIIQIAFDWQDSHLHEFNLFDEKGRCRINIISEFEDDFEPRQDCPIVLDKEIRVDGTIGDATKITYSYDYGDGWIHDITVRAIVSDYDKNYPTCLMAEGNRPPEDVGGIPGFKAYLAIMNDPEHPEYAAMKSWTDSKGYKDFDIDAANRRLRYVLGR